MFRNNSYDSLGISTSLLKDKLEEQKNTIIKSDDRTTWEDVLHIHHDVNAICKCVNAQFNDLKSDYQKGAINLVRYKEILKMFADLLTSVDEPIKNEHLNASEIATEVKRYL